MRPRDGCGQAAATLQASLQYFSTKPLAPGVRTVRRARGVGVPSRRSLATATGEATCFYQGRPGHGTFSSAVDSRPLAGPVSRKTFLRLRSRLRLRRQHRGKPATHPGTGGRDFSPRDRRQSHLGMCGHQPRRNALSVELARPFHVPADHHRRRNPVAGPNRVVTWQHRTGSNWRSHRG
jgi:hypothetical protein